MTRPVCRTYLPPEWAPQSGVMLTWPHAQSDWAPILHQVEPVFSAIAAAIARFEIVLIACHDEAVRAQVAAWLRSAGLPEARLRLFVAPANDTWARDHGPITVLCQGEASLLDFGFNGWGGKYAHDLDNLITRRLHAQNAFGDAPLEIVDLILEGGSIEVDGQGTLLTTTRCLLSATRNPGRTRAQIEMELAERLGITRFLWLEHGYLAGDDTDATSTPSRACVTHTPSPMSPATTRLMSITLSCEPWKRNCRHSAPPPANPTGWSHYPGHALDSTTRERACRLPMPISLSSMAPFWCPPTTIRRILSCSSACEAASRSGKSSASIACPSFISTAACIA